MPIAETDSGTGRLAVSFAGVDARLRELEAAIARGEPTGLAETVERAIGLTKEVIAAFLADQAAQSLPAPDADLLEVFRALARGEPSWNAIRDSCRELVYYRNCINMGREDALPPATLKMAVRTARHIFLYVKMRCIREGRLRDGD